MVLPPAARITRIPILALAVIAAGAAPTGEIPAEWLLRGVSANSLRGHVSFLASDLLEGRAQGSRGLDIAAEYIAAQFRRAGLAPAGDQEYFQTSVWIRSEADLRQFELTLQMPGTTVRVKADAVRVEAREGAEIAAAGVWKADPAAEAPSAEDVAGKVVLADRAGFRGARQEQFAARMDTLGAALLVWIQRSGSPGRQPAVFAAGRRQTPWIRVYGDPALSDLFDALPAGATSASANLHLESPTVQTFRLRNVVGVLAGSDAALKNSCVVLTAHYDHIGRRDPCQGDCVHNGANDNASGVAALMELAGVMARLSRKPRRSIVLAALFGEETGSWGAKLYLDRPVFPLPQTVANINLEHLGRTDATEGPQLRSVTLTGFEFSDIPAIFRGAGERTGVAVDKNEKYSDDFFDRSDNLEFALRGIPSHTVLVAFDYPDYHRPGDEWEKLDYDNLARVSRTIGLAALSVADRRQPPEWNADEPGAKRFLNRRNERSR